MRMHPLVSVTACAALAALPLAAQPAPTPSPQREAEVVELSPFIINAESDRGYYSANAISGTRIATPIKNLPLNLSVISEEFLRDAAIYDVDSILQWTASNTGPNNPRIRGLNSNTRVNGFGGSERDDAISIGRVEVIKGPGAVISGSGAPGGIVNVLTKRPLARNQFLVAQAANDRGMLRTELDASIRAGGNLGVRFAAARVTEDGFSSQRLKQSFYDYEKTEMTYYGVVQWKPAPSTTLTANVTYLTQDRPFRDQPNVRWDTFGRIAPAAGQPAVYLIEAPFNYPKSFGLSGPDAVDDITNTLFDVEVVHEFTRELQLKLSMNGKDRSRLILGPASTGLVTATAPLVTANPGQNLVVGERYFGVRWDSSEQVNPWSYNYEVNLLWNHKLAAKSEGKLLLGGNLGEGKFWSQNGRGRDASTNAEQRYYFRLGDINPNRARPAGLNMVYDPRTPQTKTTERNAFLVHQGSFDGGKWHSLAGIFYYDYKDRRVTNNVSTTVTNEGYNPQVGLVRQVTNSVSVYAVYAKSIQGQNQRNSRGDVLPPFKGINYETGLKLETPDRRYGGTLSFFTTNFENRNYNDPTVPDINGNTNPGERVAGGKDRSKGVDAEFVISPTPQWQIIAGYAYLDTRVVEDRKDQPQRIGQRINNHAYNNYSLWTRYNFGAGAFKGLSLGGGVRGDTGSIRQYVTIGGVPRPAEDTTDPYVELFFAYQRPIGKARLFASLNIKNVTRIERYSSQFKDNSVEPAFVWKDPVEPFLRVGLEF
jgi:iron complex outermembrane receptor protein